MTRPGASAQMRCSFVRNLERTDVFQVFKNVGPHFKNCQKKSAKESGPKSGPKTQQTFTKAHLKEGTKF